jgi:uncharacterized membrane protein
LPTKTAARNIRTASEATPREVLLLAIAQALHVLAAVVWVGGMFFAYMVLRPASGPLPPPERLPLWRRSFGGFFPWVWAAVVLLPLTGYGLMFAAFGGFAGAGLHIHVMQGIGILMILLFLHLFFAPYRRLCRALDAGDVPTAGEQLAQVRRIVAINLSLGLLTVAIAASGRYW